MTYSRAVLVGALAGVLGASAAAAAQPGTADRGRVLVSRNCSGCHAIGATGTSPNPASPRFRDLHRRYPVDSLAEALVEGILIGHPQMPEFRFTPAEVSDIIVYLKSIQTNQGAMLRPARPLHPRG